MKFLKLNYLATYYLGLGISSLLFFAWTGSYLSNTYPSKNSLDQTFRVMLRSRHIFILMVSLIEIGIGAYIKTSKGKLFLGIQLVASLLLTLAHMGFIYAFFYEVDTHYIPKTPIVHFACYLSLASLILHVLTRIESMIQNKEHGY